MDKAPICKSCRNSTVRADAGLMGTSIPYWYCKTCKEEVDNNGWRVSATPTKELDDFLEEEILRLDHESPAVVRDDYDWMSQPSGYPWTRRK